MHTTMNLFDKIRRLEELLHKTDVRKDSEQLDAILHPQFKEFGRSGRIYERSEIFSEFSSEKALPKIRAENYDFVMLSEGVVLLTYVSSHVNENGKSHRNTLRSSLWVNSDGDWRLRFHQGTPKDE